jgi:transposase
VWLPTYAPWLNPIEKLWRWLRQDMLKLHQRADDWRALRGRVRAFLEQFAGGSQRLLEYVGLLGNGQIARMIHGP